MSLKSTFNPAAVLGVGATGTASATGTAFTSAYVYNTSGQAISFRFVARAATSISKVTLFISNLTGTPGNLTVEIRDAASATKPGSTVLASVTVAPPGSARKWIQATGFGAHTFTPGEVYFVVVADAAGAASPNSTLLRTGTVTLGVPQGHRLLSVVSSGNGFSTQTLQSAAAIGVVTFANGTTLGSPYTASTAWASGTLERGLYLTGLTEDLTICGATWDATAANASGLKIYEGSTAPGGTAALTVTFGTYVSTIGGVKFSSALRLKKGTAYRAVLTYGAAETGNYFEIEDHTTYATELLAAAAGNGAWRATIDNGAGGWTDYQERLPQLALLIEDAPSIPRFGVASMAGGMA